MHTAKVFLSSLAYHDENCHDDAQNDDNSYADDEHRVPPLPQVVVTVTSTTLLTSVTWRNWGKKNIIDETKTLLEIK